MNQYEQDEIKQIQEKIFTELDKLNDGMTPQEKISRLNVLYRLNLILDNYEELEETLNKFFSEKQRWDREK